MYLTWQNTWQRPEQIIPAHEVKFFRKRIVEEKVIESSYDEEIEELKKFLFEEIKNVRLVDEPYDKDMIFDHNNKDRNIRLIPQYQAEPYYRDILFSRNNADRIRYIILSASGEKEECERYSNWFSHELVYSFYKKAFLSYIDETIKYFGEDKELILCWICEPEIRIKKLDCHHCEKYGLRYHQIYSRFFITTKEILKEEIDKQLKEIFDF